MQRIIIFTATYNEANNIENLIQDIRNYLPEQDILVIDDASPDGTGGILDRLGRTLANIHVIHRPKKLGVGTAHKLAMKYAIHHGFHVLITMDADFSHNPKYLPVLLNYLSEYDFVIGSRYIKGGKSGYGVLRTLLSWTANLLARGLLGIPLSECTTSYRGFRVSLLKKLNLDGISSEGYSFFVESLFYICLLTNKTKEFPIHFEDRRNGTSKISKIEIVKGFLTLIRLFYRKIFCFNALKKTIINQQLLSSNAICIVCRTPWQTELYPSTKRKKQNEHLYRCTSYGHRSHGRIVQCLQCGLVYEEMQIGAEAIQQMYTAVKDPVYIENIRAREMTFRYNLSQILPYIPSRGKLLDVGTYCGIFLKVAREYGFEAIGVEPSKWAVNYAREVLGEHVIEGTIQNVPINQMLFDVITLWDVLEHLPDPIQELAVIASQLKPGGFLIFSTLNIDNWFPQFMGKRWPWFMDMHLHYFSEHILKHILSKSGFQVLHVQNYCHIITLDYFFSKLESPGIWGTKYFRKCITKTWVKHWFIPFRFGDIRLYIAKKQK